MELKLAQSSSLEELQGFVRERGLSNADVARITGRSAATTSQVLGGKYKGRAETGAEMLASLREHFKPGAKRLADGTWKTHGQSVIDSMLELTYQDAEMTCITGPSGIGKTHSARAFAQRRTDVLYWRAKDGMSVGDVLSSLLAAVHAPDSGTNTRKLLRLIETLKARRIAMVICDEADLLVNEQNRSRLMKKLVCFRELYEAGIAVALLGLESFELSLRNAGETYFLSRLGYFQKIGGVALSELREYWQGLGGDPEGAEDRLALSLAPKRGALRFLYKVFRRAAAMGSVKQALGLMFDAQGHFSETFEEA